MSHTEELRAVVSDPAATRNERDAAKELIADIQCSRKPGVDAMMIIAAYLRKQQRQDRYGK